MDNQTKIIFALLAVIAILIGIFILKVTGVIKPAEKEQVNIVEGVEEKEELTFTTYDESFITKLLGFATMYATIIVVIMFIVNMVLSIGLAKLYSKINMPDWAISFQYAYPIINLILGFGNGFITNIIEFIISLISLSCLCKYFECMGMSQWWPGAMFVGIILFIIGGMQSIYNINIWFIIGIIMLLLYVCAYIISNIRLAKRFEKGICFTILLVILPGIFQPVLGFEKK